MKITSIHLKNGYKRFHDLKIDLGENPKRIIALVGSNGCGKSSVFDGILYCASLYNGPSGSLGGKDNKYHFNKENTVAGIKLNAVITTNNGDLHDLVVKKHAEQKGKTLVSFRSPYRYNNQIKITETKSIRDIKDNYYGASVMSDLDQKMEQNFRSLLSKLNTIFRSKDITFKQANIELIGELNKSLKNCLNIQISDIGDVVSNRGTLYFKKNDQENEIEFNYLSSGEKEVVDILCDLYLRKDDYTDTIFLIDEPELHIIAESY